MRKGILFGALSALMIAPALSESLGAIGEVQAHANHEVSVEGWWCAPKRNLAKEVLLGTEQASKPNASETLLAVIRAQRLSSIADHPVCSGSKVYQSFRWTINPVEVKAFAGQVIRAKVNYSDGKTLTLAGDFILGETSQLQAQRLVISPLSQESSGLTFVHQDMLGSVIAETDASQNVISRKKYLPFGKSEDY